MGEEAEEKEGKRKTEGDRETGKKHTVIWSGLEIHREKQPIEIKSKKEQGSKEENKKMVKAEWKKEEGRERENTGRVLRGRRQGSGQKGWGHATTQQRGDSINWIRTLMREQQPG